MLIVNKVRDKWLIGIAIGLAAIKFGLVPLLDFLEESRTELIVLTDRLDRSAGVVQNRAAIQKAEADLRQRFIELNQRVPTVNSADAFRLELQQRLGEIVARSESKLDVFDWVVEDMELGPGLHSARARLQVSGTVKTLAAMQATIEGDLSFASVREVRFRTEYPVGFDASGATMTLIVDLMFRPESST